MFHYVQDYRHLNKSNIYFFLDIYLVIQGIQVKPFDLFSQFLQDFVCRTHAPPQPHKVGIIFTMLKQVKTNVQSSLGQYFFQSVPAYHQSNPNMDIQRSYQQFQLHLQLSWTPPLQLKYEKHSQENWGKSELSICLINVKKTLNVLSCFTI